MVERGRRGRASFHVHETMTPGIRPFGVYSEWRHERKSHWDILNGSKIKDAVFTTETSFKKDRSL